MDFLTLAEKRYSARSFTGQKVAPEIAEKILEAGRLAPTAANFQPQRILVLDTEENLEKLAQVNYHARAFHAPLCFMVCYDNTVSGKRSYDSHDYGVTDASIVATHMMLAIADLGLASTWVGHFPPDSAKEAFHLPGSWVPVVLLPTGYPDVNGKPHTNHYSRKDLKEIAFYNTVTEKAE
jgi:nitroreductase